MNTAALTEVFRAYCDNARRHELAGRIDGAWACLEAAHIIGQQVTRLHVMSHWKMLRLGLHTRDPREVLGQMVRLLSAMLITRVWVPAGNIGRARVPATASEALPRDLHEQLKQMGVARK
jgi:hypothetical protein